MKVFAISDLHLSLNNEKPMDIFGPVWEDYLDAIEKDWNEKVSDEDIVLIAGDISWAMRLREVDPDLEYLCKFKGHKVIIKGNHDYWWSSIGSLREKLTNNTYAIQNDAIKIGNYVICGSRGWVLPEPNFKTPEDEKIYKRELIRMELSLKNAKSICEDCDKIIVMTHFPPVNFMADDSDLSKMFEEYNVDIVVFGHLHSYDKKQKMKFVKNGIKYYLTSCDLLNNKLVEIE